MADGGSGLNDRAFTILGIGVGVMTFTIFTALGVFVLESIIYGAIMGLFAGGGSVLAVPRRLRLSAVQNESDESISFSETVRRAGGNTQLGMLGVGLNLGAFVMLAIALVFFGPNPFIGLTAAIPIAVIAPYVGSTLVEITEHE